MGWGVLSLASPCDVTMHFLPAGDPLNFLLSVLHLPGRAQKHTDCHLESVPPGPLATASLTQGPKTLEHGIGTECFPATFCHYH